MRFSFSSDRYPVGTSVQAHLSTHRIDGNAPSGSPAATVTVAVDSTVTFDGLAEDTLYVAYALVGGQHRYLSFTTPAPGAAGGGAGLPSNVVPVDGDYSATQGDFIHADATAGPIVLTLESDPAVGSLVAVKKVDVTSNQVTIAPADGGTIDGSTAAATVTPWAGAVFEHVGSDVWRVVASMTTTGPAGPIGPPGPTGATGPAGPVGGAPYVVAGGNLGASYTLDCTGHPDILLVGTLNANCAFTVTNMVAGQAVTLRLAQDGAGSRTITFTPTPNTHLGAGLTLSTAAGAVDLVSLFSYNGSAMAALMVAKGLA